MSVFDTSAVLAILYEEDGADQARERIADGSISQVNVAEVLADMMRAGFSTLARASKTFAALQLQVQTVHDDHVERVAELKQVRGLSLGDCFCIALGERSGEPLITADRQWATLELAVPVELIR